MNSARRPKARRTSTPQSQEGAALIVALLLLVVMTMLGVSILSSTTQEEKMAAHSFDRSLSFQATEAALREAETWVGVNKPTPAVGAACNAATGVCPELASSSTERWLDAGFTGWKSASKITSGSIELTPQYLVEYLGKTFPCNPYDTTAVSTCKRYRITAKSNAGADRAAVMLQSIYAAD